MLLDLIKAIYVLSCFNKGKTFMLKIFKNYGLLFGCIAIIFIFIFIIFCNEEIYSWLDFNDSKNYSISTYYEIIRNLSLGIFASIGTILAVFRINIANKHTKIENEKLLLEKEQTKFNIQAEILSKVWDKVAELNMNSLKCLGFYQEETQDLDLSQYDENFVSSFLESSGLNKDEVQCILKAPTEKRTENFLQLILPKKYSALNRSYGDFYSIYTKNKIFLFPEISETLDEFNDEMQKLIGIYSTNFEKQIERSQNNLPIDYFAILKEDKNALEKKITKINELCKEIETSVQKILLLSYKIIHHL
ncbi:hypothetical protein N9W07_00415 [Alphaproteobacteria bacterium]|nr:hypothetical protein [Alphaproteobacteria bacterium]